MEIIFAFTDSLRLPKKDAMLRLNRLNMKGSMFFLLLLMLVCTVPLQIKLFLESDLTSAGIPENVYFIQVLFLFPLFMAFFGLTGISFIAACSVLVSKLLKRKLKFQFLWKMTVFALTKPILVFTFANLYIGSHGILNLILIAILGYTIYKMIVAYPKRLK